MFIPDSAPHDLPFILDHVLYLSLVLSQKHTSTLYCDFQNGTLSHQSFHSVVTFSISTPLLPPIFTTPPIIYNLNLPIFHCLFSSIRQNLALYRLLLYVTFLLAIFISKIFLLQQQRVTLFILYVFHQTPTHVCCGLQTFLPFKCFVYFFPPS